MAAPGDMAQLERCVAALHARPLDRGRPLWKIYYIDGLSGGRAAYFNVVHHACLDGLSGQAAVETLTDAAPDANDSRPASVEPVAPARSRSAFELIADVARRFDALARLGNRVFAPGGSALAAFAPNTPINRAIEAARGYAMLRISMTDVKAIGKSHGMLHQRRIPDPLRQRVARVPAAQRRVAGRVTDRRRSGISPATGRPHDEHAGDDDAGVARDAASTIRSHASQRYMRRAPSQRRWRKTSVH